MIQEEGTLVKGAREEKTIARIEACRESSKPTIRIKPRFNYPPRAYKILERWTKLKSSERKNLKETSCEKENVLEERERKGKKCFPLPSRYPINLIARLDGEDWTKVEGTSEFKVLRVVKMVCLSVRCSCFRITLSAGCELPRVTFLFAVRVLISWGRDVCRRNIDATSRKKQVVVATASMNLSFLVLVFAFQRIQELWNNCARNIFENKRIHILRDKMDSNIYI